VTLRRLRSQPGTCCASSVVGPGSKFNTSLMLRQPGRWSMCASLTLSGA